MADDDKANGDKQSPRNALPPTAAVDGDGNAGQDGAGASQQPSREKSRGALTFFRELNTNERLTAFFAFTSLVVAIGSLAVAYMTFKTASDTRDIKRAVSGLANLARQASIQATQTKRQADTTHEQLGAMKDQVGALKDQVVEAKAQTKAISDQTTAIKSSAISAVRAAQAEIEAAGAQAKSADSAKLAADAAAASNLPEFSLTSIDVNGLTDKPTSAGLVKVTIKPIFTNVGGGAAFPKIVLVKLIKENTLPETPDYSGGLFFGGNEFPVAHGGTFYPLTPFSYDFSVSDAKEIVDGKRAVVIIGYIDYDDGAHRQHRWCYAYAAAIPKGQSWTIFKVGDAPYHCQT